MIYSVILGNQKLLSDPFEITVDDHNNRFISKEDIHQKIRIPADLEGDLTLYYKTANTTAWIIPGDLVWSNHPRSFNPRLRAKSARETAMDEQHYIFLTVMNQNYRILHYDTNVPILQTYHGAGYQGCVMVVSGTPEDDYTLMTIDCLDVKTSELKTVIVTIKGDKVLVNKKSVEKSKRDDTGKKADDTKNLRSLGFVIHTLKGQLMTDLYVVTPKHKDALEKLLKSKRMIRNAIIVCVNPGATDEEIQAAMADVVAENRIRSCTEVGIAINMEIIKNLRILYLFNLDIKQVQLSCRKSH